MTRRLLALAGVVLAVAAGGYALRWYASGPGMSVTTTKISRGPLRMTVETTGTVSPLVSVNVGCEVSGTIAEITADFNSEVRKGQVLCRLNPELFEADLAQAAANVLSAQARQRGAQVEVDRWKRQSDRLTRLREERSAAAAEEVQSARESLAAAEARLLAAQAAVTQAEAVRDLARTKLERSVIYSPIDGVVLSRLVDVGQTVVAQLTTPVLFVLSPDLDRMQVHANVSESDIGRVRSEQAVEFSVDAYPDSLFTGRVIQVRNNPTNVQNVVTYTVVVEVDNRERLLKPGMTANVTIEVARREETLKVANSALRFRPPLDAEQLAVLTGGLLWPDESPAPAAHSTLPALTKGGIAGNSAAPGHSYKDPGPGGNPGGSPRHIDQNHNSPRPASGAGRPGGRNISSRTTPGASLRTRSVLWTYQQGHWQPIPVILGITDNRETEIVLGAEEGDTVVSAVRLPRPGFSLKEALNQASPENRRL